MKLIINVPDDQFDLALAVAMEERTDYARRYDKPGWGWVIYRDCTNFWVSGIKGGISVRLYKSPSQSEADRESTGWRTIDSAPRDGTWVDLWVDDEGDFGRVCDAAWLNDCWNAPGQEFNEFGTVIGTPTHWQPLPAAPMLARDAHPQDDQKPQQNQTPNGGGGEP